MAGARNCGPTAPCSATVHGVSGPETRCAQAAILHRVGQIRVHEVPSYKPSHSASQGSWGIHYSRPLWSCSLRIVSHKRRDIDSRNAATHSVQSAAVVRGGELLPLVKIPHSRLVFHLITPLDQQNVIPHLSVPCTYQTAAIDVSCP